MPFWKKKKKSNTPSVKLCPKCLKPTLKQAYNVSGFISQAQYYCTECHYTGNLYLEIDPEEKGENFINLEELKKKFPADIESEEDSEKSDSPSE
jgi:hypothetical protein